MSGKSKLGDQRKRYLVVVLCGGMRTSLKKVEKMGRQIFISNLKS